ncbi:MAG: hypothetical protein JNL96_24395 [Planctomycetaceae bacterium]|nr:hypothetical protein [Planctomycetaceae bacterium]
MSQTTESRHTTYGIWHESAPVQVTLTQRGRSGGVVVEQSRLTWRPSPAIADDVPADLSITLDINRGADGLRRFVPVGGYGQFIQNAWLAGFAVFRHARDLPREARSSYRFMKFVFDRVRAGREHLHRRFAASRDLYVRVGGRGGEITASLLPDYVGLTADGSGHSWSIRELTQRGRAAAIEAGYQNPTNDRAIPYGLMLAAELNPSPPLERAEARSRVFTALFDAGDGCTAVDDATIDDVTQRLSIAIEEHGEDGWERFERWYSGRNNNLVQSLARKSGFPRLSREVVKAALLHLGLRSYDYVAHCLSFFGQAVLTGVSEPLNADERQIFDAIYLPQDWYGGLPLLLLLERGDLIGLAVTRLWENPDDRQMIGALHRLLQIYADLAPARRAADRRFGALRSAIARSRGPGESRRSTDGEYREDRRRLENVVRRLLRVREEGCPQCTDDANWKLGLELVGDGEVVAEVACEEHGFDGEFRFSLDVVAAAVGSSESNDN